MTKLIKRRDKGFTTLSNEIFKHDLSMQSIGLYSYLLSLPDDWDFYIDEITTHFKNGRDAVRKALDELEQTGFIKREQTRSANGKFGSFDWLIVDTPTLLPVTEKPISVKPTSEKPISENPTLLSTNITKDLITKDETLPPLPPANKPAQSAYEKTFEIWQQEIGQPSPIIAQQIKDEIDLINEFTTDEHAGELMTYAITEAVMNGARNPKYVFRITQKMREQQLKTVTEVKARELERQSQRDNRRFKPSKRVTETKPNYPTQTNERVEEVQTQQAPIKDAGPQISDEQAQSTLDALARLKASRIKTGD